MADERSAAVPADDTTSTSMFSASSVPFAFDVDRGLELDSGERAEVAADLRQRQALGIELDVEQPLCRARCS